jgi:hypothetical protein
LASSYGGRDRSDNEHGALTCGAPYPPGGAVRDYSFTTFCAAGPF